MTRITSILKKHPDFVEEQSWVYGTRHRHVYGNVAFYSDANEETALWLLIDVVLQPDYHTSAVIWKQLNPSRHDNNY